MQTQGNTLQKSRSETEVFFQSIPSIRIDSLSTNHLVEYNKHVNVFIIILSQHGSANCRISFQLESKKQKLFSNYTVNKLGRFYKQNCSWEAQVGQWISPRVKFPNSLPYVSWVSCWFLPCSEGFSLDYLVFLPPQKPALPNPNLIWTRALITLLLCIYLR